MSVSYADNDMAFFVLKFYKMLNNLSRHYWDYALHTQKLVEKELLW